MSLSQLRMAVVRVSYRRLVFLNWLSISLASIALIVAAISATYTRKQAVETERARKISEAERHDRLTPDFEVTLTPLSRGRDEGELMSLMIRLVGPTGLAELDQLRIEVRDDRERRALPTGHSDSDIRAQIWCPYRFTPMTDGATADGRSVEPLPRQRSEGKLPRGESIRVQMERTRAPHWYSSGEDGWRRDYPQNSPVRLRMTCRSGDDTWTVPAEVTATGWSPRVLAL
jgi:hypothetical protein